MRFAGPDASHTVFVRIGQDPMPARAEPFPFGVAAATRAAWRRTPRGSSRAQIRDVAMIGAYE